MKTLTLCISDELHEESSKVLEKAGLDAPTAFRIFLTQVAATRSIPRALKTRKGQWETVPVDAETQEAMDAVASSWVEKTRRA